MPVQLVILHLRENHMLLFFWLVLFAIVGKAFGMSLGIPYLFLDPEYMNHVSFWSFFVVGLSMAGFSASFHITAYILDGPRFNFIGWMNRPFTRFCLNNSAIVFIFIIFYSVQVIRFQMDNEVSAGRIFVYLMGFYSGFVGMTILFFLYFRFTNKDIFKYMVCKLDEKLKENVGVTRAQAIRKLKAARTGQMPTEHFFDFDFKFKKVPDYKGFYDRQATMQVFDQNHLNLISVELIIFVILLVLGWFSEIQVFQIPAAASAILLITILIMFSGAFTYWFREWAFALFVILILLVNLGVQYGVIKKDFKAFGLDYESSLAPYNNAELDSLSSPYFIDQDREQTIGVLEKWRAQFPQDHKPKMVLLCASGGGQRSMLWTLNSLQHVDSVLEGSLMKHTRLITGASGGLIGAAFYRELFLRSVEDSLIEPTEKKYLNHVGQDNLNPIIFSLLVNDIFLGFQKFVYKDFKYTKDRGYAFEQQLNKNTSGYLDKTLYSYRGPELNAEIPMLIMSPTVINDGRKLYISPLDVSYMCRSNYISTFFRIKGIEFRDLYEKQRADSLRFLSGLRMSATFPYVTPNVTLPSSPPMEIMDAGLTDNFGVNDATRFLFLFSDWIRENTSGVIFLIIRDSQKNQPVNEYLGRSLFHKFSSPIQGFYRNFESIQDINNDTDIEISIDWMEDKVSWVQLEYNSANNSTLKERASLNWRLTKKEKESILHNIHSERNQDQLNKLKKLLIDDNE